MVIQTFGELWKQWEVKKVKYLWRAEIYFSKTGCLKDKDLLKRKEEYGEHSEPSNGILRKWGIRRNTLNLKKKNTCRRTYSKHHSEWWHLPSEIGKTWWCSLSSLLFKIRLEFASSAIRQGKENKRLWHWKWKSKFPLFSDNMCAENPMESTVIRNKWT